MTMRRDKIEDGMGFSGLAPTPAERQEEAYIRRHAAAINNHAPMLKSLEHCAGLFDTLANKLDRWATESRQDGWSTHQVEENRRTADDCRRYAASIRSALPPRPQ
jgi:hypothetical protein